MLNFSASFKTTSWTPQDIDVYIPKSDATLPPFVSYMINNENYRLLPPDFKRDRPDEHYLNIRRIIHLQKEGH
jgi:hypothetical protein